MNIPDVIFIISIDIFQTTKGVAVAAADGEEKKQRGEEKMQGDLAVLQVSERNSSSPRKRRSPETQAATSKSSLMKRF